jgi:hypothetical protein
MFVQAIEKVAGYTRAIHSISRNFGSAEIEKGAATLFFVNQDGYALTCKHVAQWISQADQINHRYLNFQQQSKGLSAGHISNLAKKLGLNSAQTSEMRITFVDCVDQITNLKFHLHPTHDLALIKFEGFNKTLFNSTPVFKKAENEIQPGAMLCRLGFPFPEFTNYELNHQAQALQWSANGNPRSPRFPIDGMLTRFLGDNSGKIYGMELSTPGLRGQSGGPLFDAEGKICGMQSRTKHLHLGFDIEEKAIIAHGKSKKVNDYAFIHLGECIHVSVIKEFLNTNQVSFDEG